MPLDDALYTRSQAVAGITSLVSTRFYPGKAPQNVTAPYVVHSVVSETRPMGTPADAWTRMQFSCFAATLTAARALAAAVLAGFLGWRDLTATPAVRQVDFAGRTEFYDPDAKLWHCPVDVLIHSDVSTGT